MVTHTDSLRLQAIVREALDRPDAVLASHHVESAAHVVENLTTHGLHQVQGELDDGTPWRLFAKVLHPVWCSPVWQEIPEPFREDAKRDLDWLAEPGIYRSALGGDLPDGMRFPHLYAVDEEPERVVLWLEQVDDEAAWDVARYAQAARALGRLAGRWPEERVRADLGIERRSLASLFYGKLTHVDLPVLAADEHWAEPVLAAAADPSLRADLERLVTRVPQLLARFEELPHGMAHGDATPHNFLGADGAELVAIDWSYGAPAPYGSDLGQLLAGRFESGEAEPEEAAGLVDVLVSAYLDGLEDEGVSIDPAAVREGFATHLAVRSAISSTITDHRPGLTDDERAALLARRIAVARVALDLTRSLQPG